VYPHAPTTSSDLTALRDRLYRPDPPEGAVEAYLDALRAEAPSVQADTSPAPARPRRYGRGAAALAAMAGLAVATGAAVSLGHQAPAAGVPRAATGSRLEPPAVPGAPIGTLSGPGSTTGLFDASGSRVVVSVSCSGSGTLDLRIDDAPPSVLTCEQGGPALAMLPSPGALGRFTIAVSRAAGVRWSLAVGALDLASA
jgi:hypothetical protein